MPRTIPELAHFMMDQGYDPRDMKEMRRDIAEIEKLHEGAISDKFCMEVDDEMGELCKEWFPNQEIGYLKDRPDGKGGAPVEKSEEKPVEFEALLDAYALAYSQNRPLVTTELRERLVKFHEEKTDEQKEIAETTEGIYWQMLREIEGHLKEDDVLGKQIVRSAYRHWNRMHPQNPPKMASFDEGTIEGPIEPPEGRALWVKGLGQTHLSKFGESVTICGMPMLGNNHKNHPTKKKCPLCWGLGSERL